MRRALSSAAIAAALVAGAGARQRDVGDLEDLLARIGTRVQQYYAAARTIVCTETVLIQPLAQDMTPAGRTRRLVYELRVEWEPPADDAGAGEAHITREAISVDGRAPRPNDEPGCMDPRTVSPEPLAMMLPSRRTDFAFRYAGGATTGGRRTVKLDYRAVAEQPPVIEWHGDCVSVDLPGRVRGRLWVDAETDDILRLDEELTGTFDIPVPRENVRRGAPSSMTIQRAESSIEYRRVQFSEPDETWVMPAVIDSLTVIRNGGIPRIQMRQTFSNYRRFTTSGRVVTP